METGTYEGLARGFGRVFNYEACHEKLEGATRKFGWNSLLRVKESEKFGWDISLYRRSLRLTHHHLSDPFPCDPQVKYTSTLRFDNAAELLSAVDRAFGRGTDHFQDQILVGETVYHFWSIHCALIEAEMDYDDDVSDDDKRNAYLFAVTMALESLAAINGWDNISSMVIA